MWAVIVRHNHRWGADGCDLEELRGEGVEDEGLWISV